MGIFSRAANESVITTKPCDPHSSAIKNINGAASRVPEQVSAVEVVAYIPITDVDITKARFRGLGRSLTRQTPVFTPPQRPATPPVAELERVPTEIVSSPSPSPVPTLTRRQQILAENGIKVRDFAFESTLPPVLVVKKKPRVQTLGAERDWKRSPVFDLFKRRDLQPNWDSHGGNPNLRSTNDGRNVQGAPSCSTRIHETIIDICFPESRSQIFSCTAGVPKRIYESFGSVNRLAGI